MKNQSRWGMGPHTTGKCVCMCGICEKLSDM